MKTTIFTFLFLNIYALAWASEPEALVDFFCHTGIGNKSSAYHGEMLQYYADEPTLGESLPNDVQVKFRKLDESKDRAVYAVLLSDGKKTQDLYAFLVKENNAWKISAIRNLALSGVFYMALQELEQKKSRTEEEEWQYRNILLTIKSDSELKAYLRDNLGEFKNIIILFSKGEKEQYELAAKHLFINFVKNTDGVFELNIGGILDNSVGYLHVPPGKTPPTMNPSGFIYIEEVVDGWYIYKTT